MPSVATVRNEEIIKSQKGFYILGKDIREVPCLRSSILLGITCGTFAGLLSFMTTSKVVKSTHIGFGSLWLVVFTYWIPCRYQYETNKAIKISEYKEALAKKTEHLKNSTENTPEKEEKE